MSKPKKKFEKNCICPKSNEDVLESVKWAVAEKTPIEIVGEGSKRGLGSPVASEHLLDMSTMTGITLFEPEELVLSAKAGTPIKEITKLLDKHNQEMQFEPCDLNVMLGSKKGAGTLGGLINTNISGPRRLKSGSARDHILGINAISGRGEEFKSGGRVVKNVTGYDLAKGVTGSYGTLAVLCDITIKVLPKAESEQTLMLTGLDDTKASEVMAIAMGSSVEVSGAAHIPSDGGQTLLRLEGFKPSVEYRIEKLGEMLKDFGSHERLNVKQSKKQWLAISDCTPLAERDGFIWRISCTPTKGHGIVAAIKNKTSSEALYDWQGGLIWLLVEGDKPQADVVRNAIAQNGGGYATLIRADDETRKNTPVFHPQASALAALSERYRKNFDPHGVLNPGRMSGGQG